MKSDLAWNMLTHYAFVILLTSVVIGFLTPLFISQTWFVASSYPKQALILGVFFGLANIILLPLFNNFFKPMSNEVFKAVSLARARHIVKLLQDNKRKVVS